MAVLLCRMLVASVIFNGIISMPTGIQAVLNPVGIAKLPEFGVGFDLTASYGYAALPYSSKPPVTDHSTGQPQ